MLANDADVPHESDDAIMRIWLEIAKPSPVSCREHGEVNVHCVMLVRGPFIVNAPTKYE
jgi:hypothetical protein